MERDHATIETPSLQLLQVHKLQLHQMITA
jgi:hypothetical protein